MYANLTAEATGRALAVRLYNMTNAPGMKDMLSLLDAWLAQSFDLACAGITPNSPTK